MKVLAWYIDLNGIGNKNTVKYPYPTGIKKCEIFIIHTKMVTKKDDTSPTLVETPNSGKMKGRHLTLGKI